MDVSTAHKNTQLSFWETRSTSPAIQTQVLLCQSVQTVHQTHTCVHTIIPAKALALPQPLQAPALLLTLHTHKAAHSVPTHIDYQINDGQVWSAGSNVLSIKALWWHHHKPRGQSSVGSWCHQQTSPGCCHSSRSLLSIHRRHAAEPTSPASSSSFLGGQNAPLGKQPRRFISCSSSHTSHQLWVTHSPLLPASQKGSDPHQLSFHV